VLDVFRKAASEGLAAGEVMTIANEWSESDPLLACALYSAWLERNQTAIAGAVWLNLGVLCRNMGNASRAEQAFRRALDAMPRFNHAHCALAGILENTGRLDEALYHLGFIFGSPGSILEVARSNDESARNVYVLALDMYGRLQEAKGRLGVAEVAYEQSLLLGGVREDIRQRYVALAERRRARNPNPDPEAVKRNLHCVHIDIVGGCQLKCVGCPEAINGRKITMIEPDLLRQCLNNIDVDWIGMLRLFNFGEPLLHKKLLEVMNVVDEFRAGHVRVGRVEISTNAQGSNMPQLEQALKNNSIDLIAVSCDGDGTKEQYEEMRPPSKWTKLLRFLDAVANIKAQNKLDVVLQTRTVVQSKEDEERWNSVLLPRGWTPEFRPRYNLPAAPENRSGHELRMGQGICSHLRNPSLFVDVDGTVVPCCAHPRAGVFGNLGSHKFSEIAAGLPRTQFVEFMDKRRPEMNLCNECEL
jgi:MoaA/NifB/PqqE/SkfB family radical SAM enzyme